MPHAEMPCLYIHIQVLCFLPQCTLIIWAFYHHSGQYFSIFILQIKKKLNKYLQFRKKKIAKAKTKVSVSTISIFIFWLHTAIKNTDTFQVNHFYEIKYVDTRLVLLVLNTESCMLLLDCADQNKALRTQKRCFILLWFLQPKSMVS